MEPCLYCYILLKEEFLGFYPKVTLKLYFSQMLEDMKNYPDDFLVEYNFKRT